VSAAEVLTEVNEEVIPRVCRIFSNSTRYKILLLLDKEARTFTNLMKTLSLNPKVLNDHLNILIANKVIAKSYPYNLYTLTPFGHVIKDALDELHTRLQEPLKRLRRGRS